jgi:hypothetical protein
MRLLHRGTRLLAFGAVWYDDDGWLFRYLTDSVVDNESQLGRSVADHRAIGPLHLLPSLH